ncbi:MAG: hypothetical protein ACTSPI_07640 [Candidatus Heimdallarchaeaceae archaeon]
MKDITITPEMVFKAVEEDLKIIFSDYDFDEIRERHAKLQRLTEIIPASEEETLGEEVRFTTSKESKFWKLVQERLSTVEIIELWKKVIIPYRKELYNWYQSFLTTGDLESFKVIENEEYYLFLGYFMEFHREELL